MTVLQLKTHDFLKDVDAHMIRQVTIEIEGDSPEQITFNIILGSNAPLILGSQYSSPRTKTYTTSTVTNKEYIENIHVTHGHIQIKQLTEMLIQEGKWQPSFQNIIENVIGNCTTYLPNRTLSAKPHGTLPKAMDFNDIISVDLKELQPEYRKEGYRYIHSGQTIDRNVNTGRKVATFIPEHHRQRDRTMCNMFTEMCPVR